MLAVLYLQKRIKAIKDKGMSIFPRRYILVFFLTIFTQIIFAQDSCDTTCWNGRNGQKNRKIQCDGSPWATVESFDKMGQLTTRYFTQAKIKRQNRRTTVWHSTIDSVYSEYDQGYIHKIFEYVNGNFDGIYCEFFPISNDTHFIFLFKNNRLIGLEKEFYKNGKIKQEYSYRNDSIVFARTYDTSGNVLPGTVLEKGNGYVTFCSEDGTLCCRCQIIDNKIKNCGPLDSWKMKKPKRRRK